MKAKQRPEVKGPSVLILHEKHGSVYVLVQDEDALFRTSLDILRARSESKYSPYGQPELPSGPGITAEQVEALPEAVKAEGKKKLAAHKQALQYYQWEKGLYDGIVKALGEGDGRAAWKVLQGRGDAEYERVELVPFLDTKDYRY